MVTTGSLQMASQDDMEDEYQDDLDEVPPFPPLSPPPLLPHSLQAPPPALSLNLSISL